MWARLLYAVLRHMCQYSARYYIKSELLLSWCLHSWLFQITLIQKVKCSLVAEHVVKEAVDSLCSASRLVVKVVEDVVERDHVMVLESRGRAKEARGQCLP